MKRKTILVTGGFGFMGSDFIRLLLQKTDYFIVNLDKLTYAAEKNNLVEDPRIKSYVIDICDREFVEKLFIKYKFSKVVHFAADTHVDNSIDDPFPFLHSNVNGTVILLEVLKDHPETHFHYISTDEVYGDLTCDKEQFSLSSPFKPSSPYAASKASGDLFCSSYHRTFGLKITISRSGNNYGPFQNKEKLIPKMVARAIQGEDLTLYGKGNNVRDWIYVRDHSMAVLKILQKGRYGKAYHIGSGTEMTNQQVCERILKEVSVQMGRKSLSKIVFIEDRLGHDFRYSLEVESSREELGYKCSIEFNTGIQYITKHFLERRGV